MCPLGTVNDFKRRMIERTIPYVHQKVHQVTSPEAVSAVERADFGSMTVATLRLVTQVHRLNWREGEICCRRNFAQCEEVSGANPREHPETLRTRRFEDGRVKLQTCTG